MAFSTHFFLLSFFAAFMASHTFSLMLLLDIGAAAIYLYVFSRICIYCMQEHACEMAPNSAMFDYGNFLKPFDKYLCFIRVFFMKKKVI